MIDSIPAADACTIVVERAADAAPICFIGLAIHGDKASLEAIERKATAAGLQAGRVDDSKPPLETMVFFKAPVSRTNVVAFYRALLANRTADLKIELVVSPVATAADGIDPATEVTIVTPDYIKEPAT